LIQTRGAILRSAPEILRVLAASQTPEIAALLDTVLPSTGFTFRQIIDVNYYKGYYGEEKTEEMLCNLYGLTQVEFFGNSKNAGLNALNYSHPELNAIQDLARIMQSTVNQTVDVMKQNICASQSTQQKTLQRT
jgi:hypothetical protein